MGSNVDADVKFLRRILFALVGLTVLTGVLAGVATVQAMNQSIDLSVRVPIDTYNNSVDKKQSVATTGGCTG